MVSTETQKPQCPVCHKADKVKKLETAYNEGMERFAPPPMPAKKVSVMRYMAFSMILVGIFIFFIIVLVGSESFGQSLELFRTGVLDLCNHQHRHRARPLLHLLHKSSTQ